MGIMVRFQSSEAWQPVLKGVLEFCLMAGQVWMDLREVSARTVLREKVGDAP